MVISHEGTLRRLAEEMGMGSEMRDESVRARLADEGQCFVSTFDVRARLDDGREVYGMSKPKHMLNTLA